MGGNWKCVILMVGGRTVSQLSSWELRSAERGVHSDSLGLSGLVLQASSAARPFWRCSLLCLRLLCHGCGRRRAPWGARESSFGHCAVLFLQAFWRSWVEAVASVSLISPCCAVPSCC